MSLKSYLALEWKDPMTLDIVEKAGGVYPLSKGLEQATMVEWAKHP